MFSYLAEVWRRRAFITTLATYRMRAKYEANRLGIVWIALRPLVNAAVYGLIFGVIQTGATRPKDYPVYVVVGVFAWEFFMGCFVDGSRSVTNSRNMVQSLAFPRMTLPLAVWAERLYSFLITLVVLVPILILFHHYPTWRWLWCIPLFALYAVFNAGVTMILARLTVHVTDLAELLPYVSRILFYASGVLFSVDAVMKGHPTIIKLYDAYPMYQVLKMARHFLTNDKGTSFPVQFWLYLSIAAVVTLVVGVLFFWSAEERYGRD
ncbi:MAG TPA: ABC transporter permease [Propionibacteriaceae bacterium]|nr:ABC transporter permease [Propionibacteriaceae bacterium]